MSEQAHTELVEKASELIDYFENELPARLIEQDLAGNDLEALAFHVKDAWAMMQLQDHGDWRSSEGEL